MTAIGFEAGVSRTLAIKLGLQCIINCKNSEICKNYYYQCYYQFITYRIVGTTCLAFGLTRKLVNKMVNNNNNNNNNLLRIKMM